MFSLESDEMTVLWPNDSLTFNFYVIISIAYQTEQLLKKKFFDSMFSLESDEMTAIWPNDSSTFTFYVIISNSILNWATFVKEVFWFDV